MLSGAATDGVTLIYFLLKNWRPFLVIAVAFIHFTRVSPPRGCHPAPFLPARPRLSTILCKFSHNFFFFPVSPLWRVSPRAVRSLPSDATVLLIWWRCSWKDNLKPAEITGNIWHQTWHMTYDIWLKTYVTADCPETDINSKRRACNQYEFMLHCQYIVSITLSI